MKRNLFLIFFLSITSLIAFPVDFLWDIDFSATFDNREGDGKHSAAETYFLTGLSPEVGIKFTDKDRIMGGAVWIQPVENTIKNGRIYPTLYYRHEGEKWKFSMGMFPMSQLREPLPGFLWSDSLTYFQKNLRGALVQFQNQNGFFDAYIDWRGIQSKNQREAFNIVFHGEAQLKNKMLLAGGYALLNHLAKSVENNEGQFVVDNLMFNPYLGLDLTQKVNLDSLTLKAGAVIGLDRDRKNGKWEVPSGFLMEVMGEWKFLGLRNSLYAGGKLFPLYGQFGSLLYQGEPYYSSSFYDRLDIYGKIYHNQYVELEAQLNFNFTKSNFMFYQRLLLNVNIGNFGSHALKKKKEN